MRNKVVVIGHGYTSRLAIVRSVGMAGYRVDVVVVYGRGLRDKKQIDCYSKYVDNVYYSPSGDKNHLINLLIEKYQNSDEKPVLVPESDYAVAVVDSNLYRLKDIFHVPGIDMKEGAVVELLDKVKQKEYARSVGLMIADSTEVTIKNGHYNLPSSIDFPCFPKPSDGGKKNLGRCDNINQLKRALDNMGKDRDMVVMVEDYLQIDKEFALVGFSDGKTVTIPAILHNQEMAHGGHFGVAKKGVVLPIAGYDSLINKFKQLILNIHFVGLFDIDFLECQGQFYFDEINFRFGGSGYAVTKAGANLPAMMADFYSGYSSSSECQISQSMTFANERTCLDDWYDNYSTYKEYKDSVNKAEISFIKDEADPAPYSSYKRFVRRKRVVHLFNKIIKK